MTENLCNAMLQNLLNDHEASRQRIRHAMVSIIQEQLAKLHEMFPGHTFLYFDTMDVQDVSIEPALAVDDENVCPVDYLSDIPIDNSAPEAWRAALEIWRQIESLYDQVTKDAGGPNLGDITATGWGDPER